MSRTKFSGKLLHAAAAIGIVTAGVSVASAQTSGGSMAGMKMGPDSKMDVKNKKTASKKVVAKKASHNDGSHKGAHHKAASKPK